LNLVSEAYTIPMVFGSISSMLLLRAYVGSSKSFLVGASFVVIQTIGYVFLGQHGTAHLDPHIPNASMQEPKLDLLALQVFGLWALYVVAVSPWFQLNTSALILGVLRSYDLYCMLTLVSLNH
jgi:hypothetical protein